MTDLEKLIESNAKAIASNAKAIDALTSDIQELKNDRHIMYDLMKDLTNKIGILVANQAESYSLMSSLDDRQQQLTNQQQQLIEILKQLTDD